MQPIINPSVFYWISVFDSLKTVSIVIFVLSSIAVVSFIITRCVMHTTWVTGEAYSYRRIEPTGVPSWFKPFFVSSIITFCVFLLVIIFIPSKETMYQMMAASLITPDNIQAAIGTGKDILTFITETITIAINSVVK
jgi:hypothetical protein